MKPWHYFVINYVKNYVKTHFYIMMWQFYWFHLFYFVKVSCDFMWRFTWKIKKLSYFHIMTWQFSTFSHETITVFHVFSQCFMRFSFYLIIFMKNLKQLRRNVKHSRHDVNVSRFSTSPFSHETITIFLESFMCFYGIIYMKNWKLSRKNVKLSRHDMILSLLCSVWQQYASIAPGPKVFSFFLVGSKALWETERDALT